MLLETIGNHEIHQIVLCLHPIDFRILGSGWVKSKSSLHMVLYFCPRFRMSEVALEPTIASYGAAMSACDAAAAWTFAMNLLDEMLYLGPKCRAMG